MAPYHKYSYGLRRIINNNKGKFTVAIGQDIIIINKHLYLQHISPMGNFLAFLSEKSEYYMLQNIVLRTENECMSRSRKRNQNKNRDGMESFW